MSEKKNTGKKAIIAVIVIALIVVIIALVAVISGKSKKGGSKSATEAGTEAGSETMRSGQFDIDYAKQVTKLADYSGIAITVSNDYEINDTAKQKYLTNVFSHMVQMRTSRLQIVIQLQMAIMSRLITQDIRMAKHLMVAQLQM